MTLFPQPARTPLTPVPALFGGKLPPYSSPIKKFVGRAVDCVGFPSRTGGTRTRWARTFRYYPARNLIVQIQGPRLVGYLADRLIARLEAGERMVGLVGGYTLWPDFQFQVNQFPKFELPGDTSDVLYGFDVDDRGYLYPAFDPHGTGILSPDFQVVHQFLDEQGNPVAAKQVAVRKVGGRYLLDIYAAFGAHIASYDVTDPANPVKASRPTTPPPSPYNFQRTSTAGGYTLDFGPDPMLGGYSNIHLSGYAGVRIPLKVPGTQLEYFAAAYNKAYAGGGGFVAPATCDLDGGETMTDAQVLSIGGRIFLAVAAGGVFDWYELEPLSGAPVVVTPPVPPVVTPPTPAQPPAALTIRVSGKLTVGSLISFSVPTLPGDSVAWHWSDGVSLSGPSRLRIFSKAGDYTVEVEVTRAGVVSKVRTEFRIEFRIV